MEGSNAPLVPPRVVKTDLTRSEQAATGSDVIFTCPWKAESEAFLFIIWIEGTLRPRGTEESGSQQEGRLP
jgi:hypothetical protein